MKIRNSIVRNAIGSANACVAENAEDRRGKKVEPDMKMLCVYGPHMGKKKFVEQIKGNKVEFSDGTIVSTALLKKDWEVVNSRSVRNAMDTATKKRVTEEFKKIASEFNSVAKQMMVFESKMTSLRKRFEEAHHTCFENLDGENVPSIESAFKEAYTAGDNARMATSSVGRVMAMF